MKITLDIILIQFVTCTWWHGVMSEEMGLKRYQPYRRRNQRATDETRKEVLKSYANMTIYAIGQARLVPTMCHCKPTTTATSLTLSNF